MKDTRVDAAIAKLQGLSERERRRVAVGPFEAQAVLILAGMNTEAHMVYSVAHMQTERAFLTLQGVADERSKEARSVLENEPCRCLGWSPGDPPVRDTFHRTFAPRCLKLACGRLCMLVNQGPCACKVPPRVAELRRRQRALLWACEAIMRPEPTEPGKGDLKATLSAFQRLCSIEAHSEPEDYRGRPNTEAWTAEQRAHLRETAAAVRQRLAQK